MSQRVAVVSDTHGNQQLIRLAMSFAKEVHYLLHLGDHWEDMEDHPDLIEDRQFFRVPGIYHEGYRFGRIPKTRELTIEGWRFLMLHDLHDLPEATLIHTDIVLHGHTHRRMFQFNDETWFINPGHLKRDIDRGFVASFALLEVDPARIEVSFIGMRGQVLEQRRIP